MPFIVKDLIEGRRDPVTVRPDCSVKMAIDLMIEHDFSQLPVVDNASRPTGMVTNGSIVRALYNFGVKVDELRVSDALVRARAFREDEDLFDLLDDLRESYAVLIVDGEGKLVGIITSFDATEYFRRNSEDMMLVEDIEATLKYYVRTALGVDEVEADTPTVRTAIEEITPSKNNLRKSYEKALRYFLGRYGDGDRSIKPEWIEEAFAKHFDNEVRPKRFGDLTFGEYVELFLHKKRWPLYQPIFNLNAEAVRNLLGEIRTIRNSLAHFRGDLNERQRTALRFCANWLSYHQPAVERMLPVTRVETTVDQSAIADISKSSEQANAENIAPIEEVSYVRESRYAPLAIWLQRQPASRDDLVLTFKQIEEIIDDKLPNFARRHRSWWANDTVNHVHSQQWTNVGWNTSRVNVAEETVTFSRNKEKQESYIRFFGELRTELRSAVQWPITQNEPDGKTWYVVAELISANSQPLALAYTFTRRKKLRAELYICTDDRETNKRIFDELYDQKQTIESRVGETVSWERLDECQPSRIAVYQNASVTDSSDELTHLKDWAIRTMVGLHDAIADKTNKVVVGSDSTA